MKFFADAMLGRLARWLRFLGYDTLYEAHIADSELVRRALREGRVVLTRDTGLASRGIGECVYVESEDVRAQVTELMRRLGLEAGRPPRCMRCNGELRDALPAQVRDAVLEHVYRTARGFRRCLACGRAYWEGSHYEDMMRTLRGMAGER